MQKRQDIQQRSGTVIILVTVNRPWTVLIKIRLNYPDGGKGRGSSSILRFHRSVPLFYASLVLIERTQWPPLRYWIFIMVIFVVNRKRTIWRQLLL